MQAKYQSDGTVKGTVLKRLQFQPWNQATPESVRYIGLVSQGCAIAFWHGKWFRMGEMSFRAPYYFTILGWWKHHFGLLLATKSPRLAGHEFFVPPGKHEV